MNIPGKNTPFTTLVGVDYSDLSALALTQAVAATRTVPGGRLHVVHAIPSPYTAGPGAASPYAPPVGDVAARASTDLREFVERVLMHAYETLPDDGLPLVEQLTTHVRVTDPKHAIVQLASDVDANLIVVGTHGRRGVSRLLLGSVAEAVVRLAPCPVLVVRPVGTPKVTAPEIEPPCPRCAETRRASGGKELWCAQHLEQHDRRHTYHFSAQRSAHQSGFLFPMT